MVIRHTLLGFQELTKNWGNPVNQIREKETIKTCRSVLQNEKNSPHIKNTLKKTHRYTLNIQIYVDKDYTYLQAITVMPNSSSGRYH